MTQKPVFQEGVFTLRNLRSMGAAAVVEVLLAFGIAGVLIWQQLRPLPQTPPIITDPVSIPDRPPVLQHSRPVPRQPEQTEPLHQVQAVPTQVPTPTTQPVQMQQPPLVPAQDSQPPQDLVDDFSTRMLRAIKAQKVYPKVSLLKAETGEAVISFDYVDGVVSDIHVDKSSGSHDLDKAAIEAVQKAVLPPKPTELASLSHFVFHLVFDLGS